MPVPSAPHSHFWPDRRVRGAAELHDVDGDRAHALRAVEDHRHPDLGERGRRDLAVRQFTCEQATSVVRGPTASASSANGTARIAAPRSRAAISGPIRPGCS